MPSFPPGDAGRFQARKAIGFSSGTAGRTVGMYTAMSITVALASILFATLYFLGSDAAPPARVATLPQGPSGIQVVQADPVPLSSLRAELSVPGRVALNGPPSEGAAVGGQGALLSSTGTLAGGDTIHVCTDLPAASAQLRLVDAATGAVVATQTVTAPPLCGP